MDGMDGANRYAGRRRLEWPTWAVLIGCHALGAASLLFWDTLGVLVAVPAAIAVGLHSSLQHEILHGHPTRSALVNEALVFMPVGLAIPYRRFRDLHLKHHNDERLTDPYDDPESFYLPPERWSRFSTVGRLLFTVNATFLGRLVIGPALAFYGIWRSDLRLIRDGDRGVQGAWLRFAAGLVPVIAILAWAGVPFWQYVLFAAYPGMSLIMVRSYIEHCAAREATHRSAIVDAGWFWRLMFLNNNYHSVHHQRPSVPWYRLGEIWRAERDSVLERNGGYYISGYGEVVRRWGLRQREPVVHPDLHFGRPPKIP